MGTAWLGSSSVQRSRAKLVGSKLKMGEHLGELVQPGERTALGDLTVPGSACEKTVKKVDPGP